MRRGGARAEDATVSILGAWLPLLPFVLLADTHGVDLEQIVGVEEPRAVLEASTLILLVADLYAEPLPVLLHGVPRDFQIIDALADLRIGGGKEVRKDVRASLGR